MPVIGRNRTHDKLKAARNAAVNPLGAVLLRNRSQSSDTRYDDEAAAMAGKSQVSTEKIIRFFLLGPRFHFSS